MYDFTDEALCKKDLNTQIHGIKIEDNKHYSTFSFKSWCNPV